MPRVVAHFGEFFRELGDPLESPEFRRIAVSLRSLEKSRLHLFKLFLSQLRWAAGTAFGEQTVPLVLLPSLVPGVSGRCGHGKMLRDPGLDPSFLETFACLQPPHLEPLGSL